MCTYCCNCGYNDFEDDCCPDWSLSNKVKGRFGLAFVAETPCCCPEPIGWQVEFCDTPSKVEQRCREMVQWVNCPPLPRCEPCPPDELCSPCLPPKCNPCCPKTNPCPPRCPPRCRPICQRCPCPSRPLSRRCTSCRCSLPPKPKRCCCQLSKVQCRCKSESTDTFYDDDEDDDDDYCPCSLRSKDNRERSETPPSDYDRPEKPSHSPSYDRSAETDKQKTVDRDIDTRGNIYHDEIPVRDTKAAVAKQPPRKTPGVFKSPINLKDRQRSTTTSSPKSGMNKKSNNKNTVYDPHAQSQVLEYDSGGDTAEAAVINQKKHQVNKNSSSYKTQKEKVLAFTTYSPFFNASEQFSHQTNACDPNSIKNRNGNVIPECEPNIFDDDTISDHTKTFTRHSAPPKLCDGSDPSETDTQNTNKSKRYRSKQIESHSDSQSSMLELEESSDSKKSDSFKNIAKKQKEVHQNNLKTFIKKNNSTHLETRKEVNSTTNNNKNETVRKSKNSNSLDKNVEHITEDSSANEMEEEIQRELERRIEKALRKHSSSNNTNLRPCIECNVVRKRRWLALEIIKKLKQKVLKLFRPKDNIDFDSDSFSSTSSHNMPQE